MDSLIIPKAYELGYVERFMTWGLGGMSQVGTWMVTAKEVVARPEGVAFISEGGILASVAQILDPDLIFRFVQGPSIQVTEYSKGEIFKQKRVANGTEGQMFTTDQVSEGQKLILLGFIPGGNPDKDRTLFPPPDVFEEESDHVRGMIGAGANEIVFNLLQDIETGRIKWRTVRDWKGYLRQNNRGERSPIHVPSKVDFDEVGMLMTEAFPISWQQIPIRDIKVPEAYDPRAHRD
ncbi:hypothetical protein B0H13DRAFT_1591603 [Mycena leptocephala]|nr:hypothetical protein B0H13DRAFT_1591603 [Mycena leptocephala]